MLMVIVAARTPVPSETNDSASPTPRIVNRSEHDAATKAPPITAPQETPEEDDSADVGKSVKYSGRNASLVVTR